MLVISLKTLYDRAHGQEKVLSGEVEQYIDYSTAYLSVELSGLCVFSVARLHEAMG